MAPGQACHRLAAGEDNPYGYQELLSRTRWDTDTVRDDMIDLVRERMADPVAVVAIDETGLVKKGSTSVAVAPQYRGTVGKIANGQECINPPHPCPKQGRPIHPPHMNDRGFLGRSLEEAGRKLMRVMNPAYTSQTCSACGHRQKMPLSSHVDHCPCCLLSIDQDVNASKNIKALGLQSVSLPLEAPGLSRGEWSRADAKILDDSFAIHAAQLFWR